MQPIVLQFQRGLGDGGWEPEERATKRSGRTGRVSVYKGANPTAKMEIPAKIGLGSLFTVLSLRVYNWPDTFSGNHGRR